MACIAATTAHLYRDGETTASSSNAITSEGAADFPVSRILGAAEVRDVITYADAVSVDDAWACGNLATKSFCIRFKQTVHFRHPIAYRGCLGISQRVPLTQLHAEDVRLLRDASGAHTDAELLALFQNKSTRQ